MTKDAIGAAVILAVCYLVFMWFASRGPVEGVLRATF